MKIENGYLVFEDTDILKNKKITATNVTALLGTNKWKKRGDALLSIFGIYKEVIDPFYTMRGAIAEDVLKQVLVNKGYEVKTWEKFAIHFDNFPKHPQLGGMIDIAIIKPERTVVECKSKNIKDLDKTKQYKNEDYEMQEKFYQYMSKCPKGKLIYVFFTDEQEEKIRKGEKWDISKEKFTFYGYDLTYNSEEIEQQLQQCIDYKIKCYTERKIPLEDISDKILMELKLK